MSTPPSAPGFGKLCLIAFCLQNSINKSRKIVPGELATNEVNYLVSGGLLEI
jgi:hypothetical protein